jgi:hypothetical protein
MLRSLHYLLGLSLWAPGMALINTRSAGLQIAVAIGILCVLAHMIARGLQKAAKSL